MQLKNVTPTKTFHEPTGEENTYVRILYISQKIYNHTLGQVLVSTNANPVNSILASQQ